jgi:mono/diheme cytochrome c family protein
VKLEIVGCCLRIMTTRPARFFLCFVGLSLTLAACESKDAKPEPAKDTAKETEADKPEEPAKEEKPAATPEQIARGKYLAETVMNCRACHTPLSESGPDLTKEYAGGLEFPDPAGTWRSPNITQDEKTGIGGWTDEQIIAAVREGKKPSGEQMSPVMPYPYFNAMSDDDAKALVAYLRGVKPVENAVAGNTDLKAAKPAVPAPKGTPPGEGAVAEGEYLIALAHCGGCHTATKEDGTPDEAKLFAGGLGYPVFEFQGTGEVYSANITPHEGNGIGKYSDEELAGAIKNLDKRDGVAIVGPMTFYSDAWSNLAPEDVASMVAFLRSVPAVDNKVADSTYKPAAVPEAK